LEGKEGIFIRKKEEAHVIWGRREAYMCLREEAYNVQLKGE
jgi:hypothetical protein